MHGKPVTLIGPVTTWVPNGNLSLPLDFLRMKDQRGNRLIIDRLEIAQDFVLTTPGGVTVTAYDQADGIKRFQVKDSQSIRRNLPGTALRYHALTERGGLNMPADPATFAASQTAIAAPTYTHVVPFVFPRAERDHDYGLACDDLADNGYLKLQMPSATNLLANGGTVTIVSGTYSLRAICYAEHDLQHKVRDIVEDAFAASDKDVQAPVNGRLVRSVSLYKEAEGTVITGGTAVTTIGDVTMDMYGESSVPRAAYKNAYILDGPPIDTGRDPVWNDRWLPFVLAPQGCKVPEMFLVERNLLIRLLNSTFTGVGLIMHTIEARSEEYDKRTRARFGLPPEGSADTIKTEGGGSSDPNKWGPYRFFMAAKIR